MSGLMDVAQAASNAVAGNVSGPVDMLAFLLRKAGVPVPEDPVLGTEWLKKRGLIRDVPQGAAQVAGETLGLLAPVAVAAKAPQIASGLLRAQENAAAPRTLRPDAGAIVWHGSPHKFDRFDSSKIGTGEGAQAYGHGLYLAESPEVARSYKDTLRGLKTDTQAVVEKLLPGRHFTTKERAEIFKAAMDEQTPVQDAARRLGYRQASIRDVDQGVLQRAIAEVREQGQGALYKVDLPDDKIARMLDWDKPLSQQPQAVREALAKTKNKQLRAVVDYASSPYSTPSLEGEVKTMGEAIKLLGMNTNPAAGSRLLAKQGIPGIRYLDGGSRGAGSGTSNFVVFPGEEGLLTILERNGVPLGR